MQLTRGLSRVGAQPRLAQSRKQGAPRPKMGFHGTQALAQSHQSAPANGSVAVQTLGLPPVSFLGLKGVLFDIDGTLTNSDPLHLKAFQEILVEVGFNGGVPIDEHFFRQHISGRHNPEIAADLFPDWADERRRQFYEDKEARYRAMAGSSLSPLPGLLDFLDWLEAHGIRKVAVTNAPRDNAFMMLQSLHIQERFEGVVLGEDCAQAKPHPDPYLEGLRLLGLQPEDASGCLVVEDSPSGIRAGVAAGVPVIGLTTGQPTEALISAGACWVVPDFEAIMEEVKRQEALPDK